MFSQACVKNFVHRGCVCIPACTGADIPSGQTHTQPRADTPLGRHPWADTPHRWPLFTKVTIFTPVFRLLLVMLS